MKIATVDAYIAAQPRDVQPRLRQIRAAIRKAAPDAEERMAYGMPGYRLADRALVYFAAARHHIGLYALPSGTALAAELSSYRTSKGTLQLPNDEPLPLPLITKVVTFRVKENLAHAAAKTKPARTAKATPGARTAKAKPAARTAKAKVSTRRRKPAPRQR